VYDVQAQAGSVDALPACNATTAGETAYVTTPPTLWSCVGNAWVPVPCTSALAGTIAYAGATTTVWACMQGAWTQITVPQGPAGPQGPQGDAGPTGATGAAGPQGVAGGAGANGDNALVIQTSFAPGAGTPAQNKACPYGGTEVDTGTNDGMGAFVAGSEITTYVCSGAPGEAGAAGPVGPQGDAGPQGPTGPQGPQGIPGDAGAAGANGANGTNALVIQTPFAPGAGTPAQNGACPNGGTEIETGTNDGSGGFVEGSETTTYVCNGPQGSQGDAGPAGADGNSSHIQISTEPPGMNCRAGGERIDVGILVDGGFEIQQTAYVCNGLPGMEGSDAAAETDAGLDAGNPGPTCLLPGACVFSFDVGPTSGTESIETGEAYTFCPHGPDSTTTPPQCIAEVDLGGAVLSVSSDDGGSVWNVAGTVPVRLADFPFEVATSKGATVGTDVTVDLGGACPGTPESFVAIPVQATVTSTSTGSGPLVVGCSPVTVTQLVVAESDVANVTAICGPVPSSLASLTQRTAAAAITPLVQKAVASAIAGQACLR
jgi:hypothetical protein